ncbi:DUF4085 family protein [Bacillus sp. SM2101]|uniref:DUF4085 family protein n=1 Tax=Bacillus sp. SM2101 TaxID=2805366 RepID=UPI001BDF253D
MKYITNEIYEKKAINEFFDLMDIFDSENDDANLEKTILQEFQMVKPFLLKHVGDSILNNFSLNSVTCFSEESMAFVNNWRERFQLEIKECSEQYNLYYKSIERKLPKNAINLVKTYFHDAMIIAYNQTDKNTVTISLDCYGTTLIVFTGVKFFSFSKINQGIFWLDHEIYLSDIGDFELRVSIETGNVRKDEFCIVADDVIFEKGKTFISE